MIDLIIYDFDGVMTNNTVTIDQNGHESVTVNRSDGLAVAEIRRHNVNQIIISTEKNPIVQRRAEKLNIPCINSVENKRAIVEQYLKEHKVEKENVIYVGNDINDLEAMLYVGWPVAPKDAHKSIKRISKFITKSKGGAGVVRDLLDILIRENMLI